MQHSKPYFGNRGDVAQPHFVLDIRALVFGILQSPSNFLVKGQQEAHEKVYSSTKRAKNMRRRRNKRVPACRIVPIEIQRPNLGKLIPQIFVSK